MRVVDFEDGIALPNVPEVTDRQRLTWEKELLGLYVSGRPADKIRADLQLVKTVDVMEAKEAGAAMNSKPAVIAGEVVTLRKILTKKGDMMAIATVEDWHDSAGSLEVVLFPRTWDNYGEIVQEGSVLFFNGKLDTARGDLQMICEVIRQNWDTVAPEEVSYMPPPPEPPSWSFDDEPYDEETGEMASSFEPPPEPELVGAVAPATQGGAAAPTPVLEPQLAARVTISAPYIAPSWDDAGTEAEGDLLPEEMRSPPPSWLMIYFKRSEDADKDRRRLTRLHGILTSYPGRDRFTIVIEDRKHSYKMEFPNHTTSDCDDLRRDLVSVVGEGNVEIYDRPE